MQSCPISKTLGNEPTCFGGIFDYDNSKERLFEVELELAEASIWDDPHYAQKLGRERSALETVVRTIK